VMVADFWFSRTSRKLSGFRSSPRLSLPTGSAEVEGTGMVENPVMTEISS